MATKPINESTMRTILVVEDEDGLRKLVIRKLERDGFHVIEATNGAQAETKWEERRAEVSLLLTDMCMPVGPDGWELARRLQGQDPNLKVLFMTGYSEDLLAHGQHLVEGADYLLKPFDMDQLVAVIRQRLGLDANTDEARD